jgi:hypothetical protein
MHTIAPGTDTRNGLTPDRPASLPDRTPFQATLLGDDEAGRIAWTLWRQGYERGVSSGYGAGYADAIADMLGARDQFLATVGRVSSLPTRDELEKRRNTVRGDADTRTGAQLIADAAASWGLTPEDKDQAA